MWYVIVAFLFLVGGYILGNKYPFKKEVSDLKEEAGKIKL